MKKSETQVANNFNPNSTSNISEMLTEVDENDNVVGPVVRVDCHNEIRRPWHRGAHLYLFNEDGELYLSQRSLKTDTAPGQWTVSAGGHVKFESTYEQTIVEEASEELGITIVPEMLGKLTIDYGSEREIIGIYAAVTDEIPKANNDKVEQIKAFKNKSIIGDFMAGEFDLSGGSRDSFRYIIEGGMLDLYYDKMFSHD